MSLDISISAIIPVYNGGNDFRLCLTQLLATNPHPTEIIVVADGDTDGSSELAKSFGVKVIKNPKPLGPAQARNLGAEIAIGEIIFFVDADVVVRLSTIGQIKNAFQNGDLTAIFGSYDDEPGCKNFLSQYKNLLHHYTHQTANPDATTFWSGCGAIRRKVFIEFGGFSISYKVPAIEDIELGYRLKASGHHIFLDKTLQVKHLKHWGIISLIKTDFFQRALPWTELILQKRVLVNDLNLKYSSQVSVAFIYILLLTLLISIFTSYILFVGVICILGLLLLNKDVYYFFLKKKGVVFTFLVIPWHWFYYFYSGLAFLIGFFKNIIMTKGKNSC